MVTNPLTLREGDASQLVELARPIADALIASGVVEINPTTSAGWWKIAAGTRVGVVNVGGLQIIVQPKVDINRLVFLMTFARRPQFSRHDQVHLDPAADLPHTLTEAFLALTKRALGQGLLKGYVTVDESLPVLRGRIREADQLRRHFGRTVPLEVRYDEYSVDVPENQLLLAAVEQLLRTPGVGTRHRAGLQHLRLQFADVSSPTRGVMRPTWVPSRLNARYVPALDLAELILDGKSFEQRIGDVVVSGYLFNMAKIFEDFVTVALSVAFGPYGGRSRLQYQTHLDEDETVSVKPDFVWLDKKAPRVVVDAKYKGEKPSGFPQADLYQMLAYCTVLGLEVGHLVYAKGHEVAQLHVVRHAGIRIVAHTLDLNAEPHNLLEAIDRLAAVMQRASLSMTY